MAGNWVVVEEGLVPLRCWWNKPDQHSNHLVLVLPEVFGVNSWVRSVVDRLDYGFTCEQSASFNAEDYEIDRGLLLEKLNVYKDDAKPIHSLI